ncbi:c-type cytochrome biogenesis protein CcmI [Duganella sp. BuS-21]|uniref:c-type cytochrome biogenesis protein CcmI n=1 Tax=Duganella sp. BuS-21 TaxID=2943848 RepID=UPI0035A6E6C7
MNGFVFAAAVMCAPVLWLLLRPLLSRRDMTASPQADQLNLAVLRDQLRELDADREQGSIDPEAYAAARRELEQRVTEDVHPATRPAAAASPALRWQAAVVSVALVAGAAGLYATLGTPRALVTPDAAPAVTGQGLDPHTSTEAEAMVAKLAERMAREPQDPNGWALLARSYSAMGRFVAASGAYARLVALIPDDAQILADYADVLAMTQNQKLDGEPERLLARALAADPKNVKALILSGDAAFSRQDHATAALRWQAALANAAPGSEFAQMARDNLAHLGAPSVGPASATAPAPAAAGAAAVSGSLELDPALRDQVSDTDTVFIVAKAADGPRFPLAVLRKQVRDLPLRFTLDDSMGMMPDVKLSQFDKLIITARISKSGNAIAAPGDLESTPQSAKPGDASIQLRIRPK